MCRLIIVYLALLQLWLGMTYLTQAEEQFPGLANLVLPAAVHTRVVGGEVTTIDKMGGFIVQLRYKGDFVCGGTLIEDRIVISAAHCFIGRLNKQQWQVQGGVSTLNQDGYKVQVQDFVVPASFEEKTMHMDVAVVQLEKPLKGKNIALAKLCNQRLTQGQNLSVYGWGITDTQATSPHMNLRTVTVPVIKKSICRSTYKESMHIGDSMFCAGLLGKKDACTFDSGGPMVYEPPKQRKQLCGIVSFGISCASPKYPGVYTDVNYVKPFIDATIKAFNFN